MHEFWTAHWWLIFPLFWMIAAMARLWSRHSRAHRALDILKSYVDQGKDPPPELLAALQRPVMGKGGWCDSGRGRNSPERCWRRAFLFSTLAVAFGIMAFWPMADHPHPHGMFGLVFGALIMAALAVANFLNALIPNRYPPDDTTPKSGTV